MNFSVLNIQHLFDLKCTEYVMYADILFLYAENILY